MAIKKIFAVVDEVKKHVENLSVDDVKAELGAPNVLLADIREIQERVDLGTIPGSKHAPPRHVGVLGPIRKAPTTATGSRRISGSSSFARAAGAPRWPRRRSWTWVSGMSPTSSPASPVGNKPVSRSRM